MITSEEQNSSRRFVEYEGRKHEVLAWELEPGDCLVSCVPSPSARTAG